MEQRLKERLTGAAILVALVVLVVPELFHGHALERGGKTAGSGDGPPLRSYTIDLGGTHSAPMQLAPTVARGLAPAAGGSESAAVAADAATAQPTASASTAATSAVPGKSTTPATSATSAMSATHGSPERPAPATAGTGTRPVTLSAATSADWSVQLGLFSKRGNAERMVRAAHARGIAASLSQPDAKGRYHVHVAGLRNRTAAMTLVARLRAAGLPAAAVGPK